MHVSSLSACKSACMLSSRKSQPLLPQGYLTSFCARGAQTLLICMLFVVTSGGGSSGDALQAPASDPNSSSPNSAQGGTRAPQPGPGTPVPVPLSPSPSPVVSPHPSPNQAHIHTPGPSPSPGPGPHASTNTSTSTVLTSTSPKPTPSPSPRPILRPSPSPGLSTGQQVLQSNISSPTPHKGPLVAGGPEGNHLHGATCCLRMLSAQPGVQVWFHLKGTWNM